MNIGRVVERTENTKHMYTTNQDEIREAAAKGMLVRFRQIGGITWMKAEPDRLNFELFEYWIGDDYPRDPASVRPINDFDHPYFAVFADKTSNVSLASFPNEGWAIRWRWEHCRTGDIRVEVRRFTGLNEAERHALWMYGSADTTN